LCTIRLIKSILLYWTYHSYWQIIPTGVCGISHKLIKSYLTSRRQQVKIIHIANNQLKWYLSSSLPDRYGIPQGWSWSITFHLICKWCTTSNRRQKNNVFRRYINTECKTRYKWTPKYNLRKYRLIRAIF
jgi:hypothetical protein